MNRTRWLVVAGIGAFVLAAFVAGMASAFGTDFKQWVEAVGIFLPFLGIGCLAVLLQLAIRSAQLHAWAWNNGYEILEQKVAFASAGPFASGIMDKRGIYRIKVRDERGEIRIGWVRIGRPLLGVLSGEVEAYWNLTSS